jgi:circadian clock protein KaiC
VIRYTSPVELSTDRYLYEARAELATLGATRAVFDSLTTMALGVPSQRRYKELVYSLAKHLRSDDTTLVMTSETEQLLGSANLSGDGVSFIADNLLQLRYVEIDGRLDRSIAVIKARGIRHATEAQKMAIDESGITITAGAFKQMRGVLTGLPYREAGDRRE